MIANLYLHQEAFLFSSVEDLATKLSEFIELKFHVKEHGDETYRHASIYEIYTELGFLYELLYTPGALPGDIQQTLVQAIDQNTPCEDCCQSSEDLEIVFENALSGFIGFDFSFLDGSTDNCIEDIPSWYYFHRQQFVKHPPSPRDFVLRTPGTFGYYFPNLHLCPDNVPPSLRTLHSNHERLMKTIIHHLAALNDFFYPQFTHGGRGADAICGDLENYYRSHGVRIGASRDSGGKNSLNFTFTDEDTGIKKQCYCDLHTKFYRFFEFPDPSPDQRADRIYFHQPVEGFIEAKVLVAHIGEHL